MRYVYLIYRDEAGEANGPDSDIDRQFGIDARRAGVYVAGLSLRPTMTSTTVRLRHGKPQFSDGPAVEADIALAGCYVLDVADDREALRWAARMPSAKAGVIEVRPLR